jgi:magnesium transporter
VLLVRYAYRGNCYGGWEQDRGVVMSEYRFYHITNKGDIVRVASLAEALDATGEGGFIWLHYSQTTKEELSLLIDPFGFHPLSIEDCVDKNQIPKIDNYPRNTFIVFNTFNYS